MPLGRQDDDGPSRYLAPHHPECFGCGECNSASLGVRFAIAGDRVRGEVTLDHRHQGAPGIAHGGAVAAALDEVLGALSVALRERPMVSMTLEVHFERPAPLHHRLDIEAWAEHIEGRRVQLVAALCDGDTVVARADSVLLEVDPEHFARTGAPAVPTWSRKGYTAEELRRSASTGEG